MPPLGDLVGQPLTPETRSRAQYEVNRMALEMERAGVPSPTLTATVYSTIPQTITTTTGIVANTINFTTGTALTGYSIDIGTTGTTINVPQNEPLNQIQLQALAQMIQMTVTATNATTYTTTVNVVNNRELWNVWTNQYHLQQGTCGVCATDSHGWLRTDVDYRAQVANRAAWNVWNDRYALISEAATDAQRIMRYSRRRLTEAELVAELQREKQLREQAEARAAKLKAADATAEKLLRTCLSPQQIEDLDKKNCFYVIVEGKDRKKEKYRIDRHRHVVAQLDAKGSIIREFCIYVPGVPQADTMLAQKLFLEASDETRSQFWETANITTLQREKEIPQHIPRRERRRYAEAHGLLH